MRRYPILAAIAAVAVATPLAAAEPEFRPQDVRAHVAFLADDLLEGRDAGARGHEISALYVASRFQALGLTPAGDGGGWTQRFTLEASRLGDEGAAVTISGPGGVRTWRHGEDVIVRAASGESREDLEAPVVFVGFGLDAPKFGFDDYRGLDVRGKIVAVLQGAPQGAPSELAAHLGQQKARMAKARGAVGVVEIPTLISQKIRPWERLLSMSAGEVMTWVGPDGRPHVDAPGVRTGVTLNTPGAEALFAGARRSFSEIQAAAEAPNAKVAGFPLKTRLRLQRSSVQRRVTTPNVVAVLPGGDPRLKDEVVIVMAHLDHVGVGSGEGDVIHNGAMDNAAGVASLLEAARAFTEAGQAPRRTLLFLASAAEEKGHLGAAYFAEHPTVPLKQVVGLVNVDMPLLTYPFTDVAAFGADHSTLGVMVRRAAGRMGVAVGPDPFPEEGVFTRSDHYPFVRKGVPSMFFATGFANGGEPAWRRFLRERYHAPGDDLDQGVDWGAAARFARLNYLVVREVADADEAPRWYAGDVFGETFAPDTRKAPVAAGTVSSPK